jgi:hypothetical protein
MLMFEGSAVFGHFSSMRIAFTPSGKSEYFSLPHVFMNYSKEEY